MKAFRLEMHEHIERKLAAVLAADIVSYSRLMGADEVGTLRALKGIRKDKVDPVIAALGGRIVKTTGDGILADFPSVIDAVACAVTIQRKMLDYNKDVPDEKRIVFRVGINIGDIIKDGNDIFGDGVNIAARLESICEPGGLCISDTACDQVRGKLPLMFTDSGEQQVKNIVRPVRVFALSPQAIAEAPELDVGRGAPVKTLKRAPLATVVAAAVILAGGGAWLAMRAMTPSQTFSARPSKDVRPTIAVLPLVSLAADKKEDYFADGLTEDIISALGRFSDITVRSRNAVFAYKGKTPSPAVVGRALDVRYIVEGSIRRGPERIRISISLTTTEHGTHIWSQNYDVAPKDIFSVQDDITRRIAGTLVSRLTKLELAKVATKPPSKLEAYDLVLRGRNLYARVDRTANSRARALFKRAIEVDPGYAPAYVGLGRVELNAVLQGWTADPQGTLQRIETLGQKAIGIDPINAGAHALLGSAYTIFGEYDRALDEMRRAVKLNSSDPNAYAGLAGTLLWSGDVNASVKAFETARELGLEFATNEAFLLGVAYILADRSADAIRTLERSLDHNKTDPYTNAVLAAAYAQAGRQSDAVRQVDNLKRIDPRFDSTSFGSLLRKPELRAKLAAAMKKAGF